MRIPLLRWGRAAVVGAALVLPQVLSAQGPSQGIKVHGHWVIEVRNADGRLQVRREFENALTTFGEDFMSLLLDGDHVDMWEVTVGGTSDGSFFVWSLVQANDPRAENSMLSKNLTRTRRVVDRHHALLLQGSFVASRNIPISFVETTPFLLESDGGHVRPERFTQAHLDAEVPIQATQTVSVTVTFTFS